MDAHELEEVLAFRELPVETPIFIHGKSEDQKYLAFPKHVIDYIIKNPKSPKQWKKLIQTCKLFFDKNPIVVYSCLHLQTYITFNENGGYGNFYWFTCSSGFCNNLQDTYVDFEYEPYKLWITETLSIRNGGSYASELIPQIYKCDYSKLRLLNQALTFEELLFLTPSNVTCLSLTVYVYDKNEKLIPLENVLEALPHLKMFDYYVMPGGIDEAIKPDTINKIVEMEHVKKLQNLTLRNIPPILDFNILSKFMLENKHIQFNLVFENETTTEEYLTEVTSFVEQLKIEEYGNFKRPSISIDMVDLVNGDGFHNLIDD